LGVTVQSNAAANTKLCRNREETYLRKLGSFRESNELVAYCFVRNI
jgi:hypothetical protein